MNNALSDDTDRFEAPRESDRGPSQAEQVAPGVLEERRLFITAPIAAAAAMFLSEAGLGQHPGDALASAGPRGSDAGSGGDDSSQLDFDQFFQQCAVLAKQAFGDQRLNEDAHLHRIAAVAARLMLKSVPEAKTGRFGSLNPPVNFGPVRIAAPLGVILWRLDPWAVLPPHNHTPADVLSLCLSGEARVRHFDIVGEAPEYSSKNSFLIRETRDVLLTPGRVSGLTQTRDNIHTFQAGEQGAVGIDINTFLPGNKEFSFMEITDKPVDARKQTYEAVWTKIG